MRHDDESEGGRRDDEGDDCNDHDDFYRACDDVEGRDNDDDNDDVEDERIRHRYLPFRGRSRVYRRRRCIDEETVGQGRRGNPDLRRPLLCHSYRRRLPR